MAYEVVRKKRFLNRFVKVLQYLETEWGHKVAVEFLDKTDNNIELIRKHPYIGIESGIRNVRSVLVTKHNRLFYRIAKTKK